MPKRDRWSSDDEDELDDGKAQSSSTLLPNKQADLAERLDRDEGRLPSRPITKLKASLPPALRLHNPLLHGCRSVYESYERISHLDEGTYGVVWKAQENSTGEIVAIKQIKFDSELTKEGFPVSALREIGVLLSLSHECIVTVREMVVGNTADKVFMVMECMEMDLQAAMKRGSGASTPYAQSEVKFMMHQILSAMAHVHEHWFIHRDIKTR